MVEGTRGGKVGDKVEKGNTEINSNSSTDTNRKKKKKRIMMACWNIGGRGRKGTYICIDWARCNSFGNSNRTILKSSGPH